MWILVIIALVAFKSNRNSQAWLIFIPLLTVFLLLTGFSKIIGANSGRLESFTVFIEGLIFGQALMWLLAGNTAVRNLFVNCVISLIVMMFAAAGAVVSSMGFEFNYLGTITAIAIFLLSLAIIAGQGIAGRMCRKKYSIVKFSLLTALWETAITASIMGIYGIIVFIAILSQNILQATAVLFAFAVGAGMLSILIYGVSIPFLLLVQKNRFWQQRFYAWTRVANPADLNIPETPANTQVP